MNWFIVVPDMSMHGMEDTQDTEGLYLSGRIIPSGAMIPLEWKGLQRIRDLYLPANQLQEYEPEDSDWPILYMLWPAIRPRGVKLGYQENARIRGAGGWASGWYEIAKPDERRHMSSVPYGLAALCDVEGICKAGDIAMPGEIVPAPFFAGLNFEQFDRLETIGLCSQKWLSQFPFDKRAAYMREIARPAMRRVAVSPYQKEALLEKFPGLQETSNAVIEKTVTKRKGK